MPTFPNRVSLQKYYLILTIIFSSFTLSDVCLAELLTVTAEGEYLLGDHDTKEDGTRLALEAAKRHALEQVVTYVESVTTATALEITRDEIRTYTAGVVFISAQHVSARVEGDHIIMHVDVTAQIDPEDATLAVITLRQNDDARQQLQLLRTEVDDLQQQLEQMSGKLAAATSPEQVLSASQQRQDLINQVQSDRVLTQAWTDWALMSPTAYPSPWIGVGQAQGLWTQASLLFPANPHLVVLQRVLPGLAPPRVAPALTSTPIVAIPQTHDSHPMLTPRSSASMASPSMPLRHLQPTHRLPPSVSQFPAGPPRVMHQPFHMPSQGGSKSSGTGHGHGHR